MKESVSKNVFLHPLILGSVGVVAVIALGSFLYYKSATNIPTVSNNLPSSASSTGIVTTGTVEPAQNPDLAFQSGGRVAHLAVVVGDTVTNGEVLSSLDNSGLLASRAQASANLSAAQAKLDGLNAGPRAVDVSAKQTAVAQAQTTLQNAYTSAASTLSGAYDKSFSGVSNNTDTLFNQASSPSPTLVFTTTNNQLSQNAANLRAEVNADLATWKSETAALAGSPSPNDIHAALTKSLAHLAIVRGFANAILEALGSVVSSSNFTSAQIATAQTNVSTLRDTTNTLIASLQTTEQQLSGDTLAVTAANDALNQTLANATPQDIEAAQAAVDAAQAQVQNINAQISNAEVVAPFAGTVASVHVKVGDIISPNTVAISLNPKSALQITSYVSESDSTQVTTGEHADITLDAYGSDRHFDATVVSVDKAPTMQSGVPAYKVVLQFAQSDPAIASGMTANVTFVQQNI